MYNYIPYHENYCLLLSQLGCGHFCLWSRAKYDLIWCTYSTSSRFLQRRKGNYISSVKMRSGQLKRIYRKMRFFCASTVVTCVAWLGTPRAHIDAFWLDLFRWGLNKLRQTHHIHSYFWSSVFLRNTQNLKKSSSWFWQIHGQNHEEDFFKLCAFLKKSEL